MRAIVQVCHGDYDYIYASDVEALAAAWQKRKKEICLLFADCPERSISDFITQNRAPSVYFAEDPEEICEYAIHQRKISAREAARLTTLLISSFHDMILQKNIFLMYRSSMSVYEFIQIISSVYELRLSPQQAENAAKRIGINDPRNAFTDQEIERYNPHARQAERAFSDLSQNDILVLKTILAPFTKIYRCEPLNVVEWSNKVFFCLIKDKATSADIKIDLVGPARFIVFGPYLHLPAGVWTATIDFEVANNDSGNVLIVDTAGTSFPTIASTPLPPNGRFTFEHTFEVTDPRTAIELRLATAQGAIEGCLFLHGATLRRRIASSSSDSGAHS